MIEILFSRSDLKFYTTWNSIQF